MPLEKIKDVDKLIKKWQNPKNKDNQIIEPKRVLEEIDTFYHEHLKALKAEYHEFSDAMDHTKQYIVLLEELNQICLNIENNSPDQPRLNEKMDRAIEKLKEMKRLAENVKKEVAHLRKVTKSIAA